MLSSLLLPPLIWACLPDTQRVFEFKHQPQKHWECPPHLASRTSALGSTNFKDFAPNDALFLTNAHTFFSLSLSPFNPHPPSLLRTKPLDLKPLKTWLFYAEY